MKSCSTKVPSNIDAEHEILGILLNCGNEETKGDIFWEINAADFYSIEGQAVYEISLLLWKNRKPVNFVTVSEMLSKTGRLEKIGGISALTQISGTYISGAMYKHLIDIIKINSSGRQALQIAGRLQSEVVRNPEMAIDKAVKELCNIGILRNIEIEPIQNILNKAEQEIIDRKTGNVVDEGAEMPFKKLNKVLQKMTNGDVTIIAARPGIGKSAFLNQIILHNAFNGKKVVLFSLEMRKREIAMRFYSNLLSMSMYELTSQKSKADLAEVKSLFKGKELYVEDETYDLETMMKLCRVHKKRKGLDMICIDYLQLMKTREKRNDRRLEIESISRELKLLAGELNVPIILLSQMNRAIEYEQRAPMLADLRESGAIEQDASQVIFLHQNKAKAKELGFDVKTQRYVQVYVAKNRNGAVGVCYLKFEADKMKFIEIDEEGRARPSVEELEQIEMSGELPF